MTEISQQGPNGARYHRPGKAQRSPWRAQKKARPGRPKSSQGGSGQPKEGVQAGQLQLVTRPPAITTRPAALCSSAQTVYGPAARSG